MRILCLIIRFLIEDFQKGMITEKVHYARKMMNEIDRSRWNGKIDRGEKGRERY